MPERFGERLYAILKQSGMTQKALAEKTGLTEAAVSRYISGAREPRAVTVAKIAKELGVSSQELLGTGIDDEMQGAVRLVARNANKLTDEQRDELIIALMKR